MIKNYRYCGLIKRAALSTVVLCAAATAARAQFTGYGTNFDGTETNNGVTATTTYTSTPNAPTSPLSGQNGWGSNDAGQTGTPNTSTQLVGKSDFVLATGSIANSTTGLQGLLGGAYHTTTPTAASPDVVPSTNSGGIVSLFHTVSAGGNTFLSLNVDFVVVNSSSFTAKDTFSFALTNTAGAALVSINFAPSGTSTMADTVTGTSGGTTVASTAGVTFGSTYHLALSVNLSAKTYSATLTGSNSTTFGGSIAGASILPKDVTTVAALWALQNKTATGTAYNAAGDNYIIFDNLNVTVPEPSTYAMMALGLVGLGVLMRRKVA